MAENTTKNSSVAQNGSKAPNAVCAIPGCVHHIEGTTTSDKVTYKFRTHFMSMKEVYNHAGESMQRVVAYRARTGKAIPVASDGAIIDIDHTGSICETYENLSAKLSAMSESERQAYEKSLQMQLDALRKSMSTSHSEQKTG